MADQAAGVRVLRVAPQVRDPQACRVDIEGAGSFLLDALAVRRLCLEAGTVLDARRLAEVQLAAARQEARTVAQRLLARRLRGRVELERALRRRGIVPEVVVAVCTELRRSGWLDDERFARAWVRDRLTLRPCGSRRLRAELAARGIEPGIADRVIAELLPPAAEEDLAIRQARARWARMRGLPADVARRRLAAWLQRRGFSRGMLARALRTLNQASSVDRNGDSAA